MFTQKCRKAGLLFFSYKEGTNKKPSRKMSNRTLKICYVDRLEDDTL